MHVFPDRSKTEAFILAESWLSPWNSTSQLIDLQAVSTQGANQALIRHQWLVDDG